MATIVSHVIADGAAAPPPPTVTWSLTAAVAGALSRLHVRARPLTRKQTVLILDELADLLEAGLGLMTAVGIVGEASPSAAIKAVCLGLIRRLKHGATLSEAMERERFSTLIASSVRAGEETGDFAQILRNVAEAMRREMQTRADVLKAMAYPILILVLLAGVMALFLSYVLPRIEPLLGHRRPPATQLLMGIATLVTSGCAVLLGGMAAIVVAVRRAFHSEQRFRIPLVGPFLRTLALERLFGYMTLLTKSGVHLMRALEVTAEAIADPVVAARCRSIVLRLQHGMPMAEAARLEPLISPIAVQLIAVGEEAGLLDRQFEKLHRLMKRTIERQLRMLVAMVGPTMLLVCAGFILLLFFGLFLPMYENISSLQLSGAAR